MLNIICWFIWFCFTDEQLLTDKLSNSSLTASETVNGKPRAVLSASIRQIAVRQQQSFSSSQFLCQSRAAAQGQFLQASEGRIGRRRNSQISHPEKGGVRCICTVYMYKLNVHMSTHIIVISYIISALSLLTLGTGWKIQDTFIFCCVLCLQ